MIQSLYRESQLDGRSWINCQTSSSVIDSIRSSPVVTSIKISFHQSHYCGHRFLDLASQISQNYSSLSRSVDPILMRTSLLQWTNYRQHLLQKLIETHIYVSVKLQQSHCKQQYHLKSKNQSHNYNIETITDDRIKIQVISYMVTLSTSYFLTTICTRHPISIQQIRNSSISKKVICASIYLDQSPSS